MRRVRAGSRWRRASVQGSSVAAAQLSSRKWRGLRRRIGHAQAGGVGCAESGVAHEVERCPARARRSCMSHLGKGSTKAASRCMRSLASSSRQGLLLGDSRLCVRRAPVSLAIALIDRKHPRYILFRCAPLRLARRHFAWRLPASQEPPTCTSRSPPIHCLVASLRQPPLSRCPSPLPPAAHLPRPHPSVSIHPKPRSRVRRRARAAKIPAVSRMRQVV
jgi:hypothetical protein